MSQSFLQQFGLWLNLFETLCGNGGLYGRETILSLLSSIARVLREQNAQGVLLAQALGDTTVESLFKGLEPHENFQQHWLPASTADETSGAQAKTGFVLLLSNRLCAAVYWSQLPRQGFRMVSGGWTFHPGDVKTLLKTVLDQWLVQADCLPPEAWQTAWQNSPLDRRYDSKLGLMTTSLVNSLENRNRDLLSALDQVQSLNKQAIENERFVAMGQLASVIAHEIRNPLGLIDLYAKLVETQLEKVFEKPLKEPNQTPKKALEPIQKNLQLVREACSSLETILSELSSYAKPLTLDCQATPIWPLVENLCTFYQPSYQQKNVTLSLQPADDEVMQMQLMLDPGRIRQALLNVLKNALEASEPGTTVTVTLNNRKDAPDLYIKVRDQGRGVDPAIAHKLFTPYFSTKGNGTGLGLAHSRKILQAHGGSVELLSSVTDKNEAGSGQNSGSTFALILPKQQQTY